MSNSDSKSWFQKLLSLRLGGAQKGLSRRSDLHLARKFFHMSGAATFLFPYLFLGFTREAMVAILGTVLAVVMSIENKIQRPFSFVQKSPDRSQLRRIHGGGKP